MKMIWAIVSKDEMRDCKTSPVFGFYREALGKENIHLAVVCDNDRLDFVAKDDIVLLRTGSKGLITTIEQKGLVSTAERYDAYSLVEDKVRLSEYMRDHSIKVPAQHFLNDIEDDRVYFVKPRYGSDSIGITLQCICRSKKDVFEQVGRLYDELHQEAVIEDFIDGIDITVSCCSMRNRPQDTKRTILTAAIMVECEQTYGIQTRDCKAGFKEYCSPLRGKHKLEVENIAKTIFNQIGLKHHARMDFRLGNDGKLYLIDINLLPGLGPMDHFSKSLLLTHNLSYIDAIHAVVNSSTR